MTKSKLLASILLSSLFMLNSASHALGNNTSQPESISQQSIAGKSASHSTTKKSEPVKFPALNGPYHVGTETFHWIDTSRPETFTANKNDHRELMIQVWYPTKATSSTHKRQSYADNPIAQAEALESYLQIPKHQAMPLFNATTHSLLKAPIATSKQKYPVLLFSHGLGMCNDSYRYIVEPLASQGYIVVSIQHTYNSFITTFPDGRVAPFIAYDPDTDEERTKLITNVWVKDVQFVLDHLEQLAQKNNYSMWRQIDLERVGIMGHSFGGAASAQVTLVDDRIKAGINMDGSFTNKAIPAAGIPSPFLIMSAAIDGLGSIEKIDAKKIAEENGVSAEEVTAAINETLRRTKQFEHHSYPIF